MIFVGGLTRGAAEAVVGDVGIRELGCACIAVVVELPL